MKKTEPSHQYSDGVKIYKNRKMLCWYCRKYFHSFHFLNIGLRSDKKDYEGSQSSDSCPSELSEMHLEVKLFRRFVTFEIPASFSSPCATGVTTQLRLSVNIEPVRGVGDPAGPVGVARYLQYTLVPQLTHVDLQSEQGEHHQTEDGERHDLRQLLDWVQQGVDDRLQTFKNNVRQPSTYKTFIVEWIDMK